MGVAVKVGAVVLLIVVVATTTAEGRLDVSSMVAQVMKGEEYWWLQYPTSHVPCCSSCECTKSNPPECHCHGFTLRTHVCTAVCPENCACTRIAEPMTRCSCGASLPFCFPSCSAHANANHFVPTA